MRRNNNPGGFAELNSRCIESGQFGFLCRYKPLVYNGMANRHWVGAMKAVRVFGYRVHR